MVALFKPSHLGRFKDIAKLLFKYGRGELVEAAGIEVPDTHNGRSTPHAKPTPEAEELAADLD